MSVIIQIDEKLYQQAKSAARVERCTISDQIEFWAKIGKCALDNPDLPAEFIRDILISKNYDLALAESVVWRSRS